MEYIQLSEEVKKAKEDGRPVVVLETAGVFEGVSYPDNMALAHDIEEAIKNEGAVPAFAAIIDGTVKLGLTDAEKEIIANPPAPLLKASRRDIGFLISRKETAVTAVAAAMMFAGLAGFSVVSGGGIGGVHRDYAKSLDVSADLEEFGKSDVIVVCSGAKAILDLPFTMEYLETKSVPIAGYGTNELPAYTCRKSGIRLNFRVDSPIEAAAAFIANRRLGINGGMLIANPIAEEYALNPDEVENAIEYGIAQVKAQNVTGKVVTKFMMDIVNGRLGNDSAEAGRQMNISNAVLAAKVAVCLASMNAE